MLMLVSAQSFGESVTAELTKRLQGLKSFKSEFQQLVLDPTGQRLQETAGTLFVKRPGLFRWETIPPFEQLLVADGKMLWVFDKDLEQVTVKELDDRLSQTPALLLSGAVDDIEKFYRVEGKQADNRWHFQLYPKQKDSLFSVLRMVFSNDKPSEMQLEDSLGQKTTILFANPQVNPALTEEMFKFVPPKGVDVLTDQ